MSTITADALTVDEPVKPRSRTYSPEVVAAVISHLDDGAKNVGVGSFDSEGAARSALVSLNKLIQAEGKGPYAGTVRQTEDGQYKAIVLNKPAKRKAEKTDDASAAPRAPRAPRTRRG